MRTPWRRRLRNHFLDRLSAPGPSDRAVRPRPADPRPPRAPPARPSLPARRRCPSVAPRRGGRSPRRPGCRSRWRRSHRIRLAQIGVFRHAGIDQRDPGRLRVEALVAPDHVGDLPAPGLGRESRSPPSPRDARDSDSRRIARARAPGAERVLDRPDGFGPAVSSASSSPLLGIRSIPAARGAASRPSPR